MHEDNILDFSEGVTRIIQELKEARQTISRLEQAIVNLKKDILAEKELNDREFMDMINSLMKEWAITLSRNSMYRLCALAGNADAVIQKDSVHNYFPHELLGLVARATASLKEKDWKCRLEVWGRDDSH